MNQTSKSIDSYSTLPLAGLVVLELGTIIAGPFAGSLLADLGALVIKIEQPNQGDGLRNSGPVIDGVSIWWGVASRNKKCISLDLKSTIGHQTFCQLIAKADVLIENYRPGVLDRLDLSVQKMHLMNSKLIVLSISGYGQDGINSQKPGFGKIAEGLSGIVPLTGKPTEPPLFTGFSLADTSAGLYGAFLINVLLAKGSEAKNIHLDLALYEPLLKMLEFQFHTSDELERTGSNHPYSWGMKSFSERLPAFQTCDKKWLQLRIDQNATTIILQECGILPDQKMADLEIDQLICAWLSTYRCEDALEFLASLQIAACQIQDGQSIAQQAYFTMRADLELVKHPDRGQFPVPGFFPKYARTVNNTQFRATEIGADNDFIFREFLHLSEIEISQIKAHQKT